MFRIGQRPSLTLGFTKTHLVWDAGMDEWMGGGGETDLYEL